MHLTLQRQPTTPQRVTHGELIIAGQPPFSCYTLEDAVREIAGQPVSQWKIPHETAIPSGTYPLTLTLSARFKTVLPLVGDVPGFSGIRIHAGNVIDDTDGCILVGLDRYARSIGRSRIALARLLSLLQSSPGPHMITIRNA